MSLHIAKFCYTLQRFKDVAYDAAFRQDLLDEFDQFMDDSLVLPIGQRYDQETLLPILHKLMEKEKKFVADMAVANIRKSKYPVLLFISPLVDVSADFQTFRMHICLNCGKTYLV